VKELVGLENLICSDNELKKIDVGQNTKLKVLICCDNPLEELKGTEELNELTYFNAGDA
jgi:Leucine-rich repeat (LRR) protein